MKHILIYGERRSGKSTMITEIAEKLNAEIYGYMTRRLQDTVEGFHPIYIHPAGEYLNKVHDMEAEVPGSSRGVMIEGLQYVDENLIAWCDGKKHEPNIEAFDWLGAGYIREAYDNYSKQDVNNDILIEEQSVVKRNAAEGIDESTTADNCWNLMNENEVSDRIIIMDEIGFLEGQAKVFRSTVMEALKGSIPVIAGVKMYPECDFTNEIIGLDNVYVFRLTPENREEIRSQVVGVIVNEWGLKFDK